MGENYMNNLNNITDKELKQKYETLLDEYTRTQNAMFNYTNYVKEHKDKPDKILSPEELITKRTKIWTKLNPIIQEIRKRKEMNK